MKTCSKCGELKPYSSFTTNKDSKDGYYSVCKDCKKKYYQNNRDQFLKNRAAYYDENIELCIENQKEYYYQNRQKILDKQKLYYLKNKKKILKYTHEWNEINRDYIKERQRAYNKSDIGKIVSSNSHVKRRELINKTPVEDNLTVEQWDKIISSQKNRCAICGKSFDENTRPSVDHILPVSKGGLNSSDNIQAVCLKCNQIKHCKIDYNYIQTWAVQEV